MLFCPFVRQPAEITACIATQKRKLSLTEKFRSSKSKHQKIGAKIFQAMIFVGKFENTSSD